MSIQTSMGSGGGATVLVRQFQKESEAGQRHRKAWRVSRTLRTVVSLEPWAARGNVCGAR